jgi:PAS domain S-box-containing protein
VTAVSALPEADDLEDLFENAPCGYLSTLPNGRISRANKTFSTWTGFTSEQLVGRRFLDLLNIAGKIFYETHFAPLLRMQGSFNEFALDIVRADGNTLPVLVNAVARQDADGAIRFIRVTVFNASDRRRYERDLLDARRTAEQTGRALQDLNATLETRIVERARALERAWRLSRDLLAIVRTDGVLTQVNAAWTEHLGWQASDLVGRSFVTFTHPDDIAATQAAFAGIFEAPITLPYEYRFRHADGTYRWFAWTAAFEDDEVHATGRATTAEHEQAALLAEAEDALRQSQKMEAVGQLTGGLAHDFNNLLAAISGSLELMQTRMSQGRLNDLDRYMHAAQGASKRAAALTHRLLAFSRRQSLDPKPTDVNRLVAGMEDLIRRTVGPSIHIETVGASGLWPALIDPPQLENALLNLCINARDAMPDGGRITIETANKWIDDRTGRERDMPPGQYLSLCVTDTGTGMPPEVIARVFDPFYTTKPVGQGTGLGLSMIYGFARQSGGQVRIYSEVGLGTTMCLYLPRHYGEVEAEETSSTLSSAPRTEQDQTVLIVDDEPAIRMLVTEILEELGYTAIEAADSAAGLKVLQSNVPIDLLVTDVGLPGGMNGRQMADAARVSRPDLKVLFITGYAENAAVGNGLLESGMHVLTKPFAMEALASRVKSLIVGVA